MKIYKEISLTEFEFWAGGLRNALMLTEIELELVEEALESELFSETEINDIFWFNFDVIAEILGMTEEEIIERYELCKQELSAGKLN